MNKNSNKKVYFPLRIKDIGYIKRLVNIIIDVLQEKNHTNGEKEFMRDTINELTELPKFSADFSAHIYFSYDEGKLIQNTIHRIYYCSMDDKAISLSYSRIKGSEWEEPYKIIWFQSDVRKRINWKLMDEWFSGVENCLNKKEHSVHFSSSTILIKGRQINMELPYK